EPVTAFFARLVAGRIARARGRSVESLDHYAAALKLFPDAQSALLGASQAAVMGSDIAAALSFVRKLGPGTATFEADPWLLYRDGAGRDAKQLLAGPWADVPKS